MERMTKQSHGRLVFFFCGKKENKAAGRQSRHKSCRLGSVPTEFLDLAARLVPQPSPGSTICTRPTGLVQSLVNLVQKPLDTIQKKPLSGSGKIRWRHSGGNLAAQNQPARTL